MNRQWTLVLGLVGALVLGVAIAVKVRPSLALVEVGSRAPDFPAVRLPAGDSVQFAQYRGKVVLLNVWATWCQPCRVEMPALERLSQHFVGTDFVVVAVSVDIEGPDVVEKFVNDMHLTFDILHDRSTDVQRIYQTTGVPESFVIDRDGTIIKKVIGPSAWDGPVNQTLIQRLLDAR